MSIESVINLNDSSNDNLQNVESDISNSAENVNKQSEENRDSDIDDSVTNSSVTENETENNSASPLMEEKEKYVKLNNVMYILGTNVLLLFIQACLSLILAIICKCNGHTSLYQLSMNALLLPNCCHLIINRIWKLMEEGNVILRIILEILSLAICAEIRLSYDLYCVYKSRAQYQQTMKDVDDLRYLLCMVTVFQVLPQFVIQVIYVNSTENSVIISLQIIVMILAPICFISAVVTFVCCNYTEELGEKHRVTIVAIMLTSFSTISYLFDVFSDLILTGIYFYAHQWLYACLTLAFIIVPGFYIIWLRHYRHEKEIQWGPLNLMKIIFNLDPALGYSKSMKLIVEVRHSETIGYVDLGYGEDRKKWYAELVKNNHTVAVSRYNEGYTESTMQLILQIAILLQQSNADNSFADFTITKILVIVSSLTSLAIGPVSMFRTKRIQDYIDNEELKENDPLRWTGMLIQFMGYFPVVVTRVLAISFAVSAYPVPTTCLLIGNCIVVYLFITSEPATAPLPYKIGQSVIYTFTPPIDDLTTEMSFHIVYLLQNVLLTIFWARTHLTPSARCPPIYLIFAFNIIGIAIRYYYQKNYTKFMKIPLKLR